jgi:hypothetical protein
MFGWMPVLGGDHQIKAGLDAIRDRDHFITKWHGKRSPRTKVILNIDQDQTRFHNHFVASESQSSK